MKSTDYFLIAYALRSVRPSKGAGVDARITYQRCCEAVAAAFETRSRTFYRALFLAQCGFAEPQKPPVPEKAK